MTVGAIIIIVSVKFKIEKNIIIAFIIVIIGLSYPCFSAYMIFIPNFKGYINEGVLQETISEAIEGKETDYDKLGGILDWFVDEKENLYDSWILTHSEKPYFTLPLTYIIFLTEEPYICIRCFEENDPRWLLTSRCGACGEYSRLFMIMVDSLGYNVRRIHAPGEDHLWNEVKIGNYWIPVDPTNVSYAKGGDGWEDYSFFEWKEGNASYVWAEYLHNNTILDRTHKYTDLTNITIHAVGQNNNSVSGVNIIIISNNLHDADRIHETYIKDKPKPKTNDTGYCTFQIGGGTYKFKVDNNKYSGETEWIEFSDSILLHNYTFHLTKK
jgi:hypothetical protein